MRTVLITSVLVAACSKGDNGDDWSKRAVKTVSASARGVAFTIDLPDGMRQRPDRGDVEFAFHIDGYTKTPQFTIGTGGVAKTIDEYVKFEPNVDNWLRKETLPDGGFIASHENAAYKGKEDYLVYVYRPSGENGLSCLARVTPWSRGATVKDKVPLIEKACLSLKPAK